jgi:hypothetical protein
MGLRLHLVGFLALVVISARGRPAEACCVMPEQFQFAPPSGAMLPLNPRVLLFVRKQPFNPARSPDLIEVRVDGRRVPVAPTTVMTSKTYDVLALRVPTTRASNVEIVARTGKAEARAVYRCVKERARSPANESARVLHAEYSFSGHRATFALTVSPWAPAYRVTWKDQSVVVPDYSRWGGRPTARGRAGTVIAGEPACPEYVVPTTQPFAARITPLFANGEEGEPWAAGRRCRREHGASTCTFSWPVVVSFVGRVHATDD